MKKKAITAIDDACTALHQLVKKVVLVKRPFFDGSSYLWEIPGGNGIYLSKDKKEVIVLTSYAEGCEGWDIELRESSDSSSVHMIAFQMAADDFKDLANRL